MPELIDSSCNNRPPLYHMVVSRRRLNLDWNSWWGQCFIIRWLTMYGGSGVRHPLLRGFNFQNLGISGIPVKCFGAPGLIHFRKKLRKRNESYCCFTSEKYWRSFQFISFMWLLRDICSCCVILIALAWHEMLHQLFIIRDFSQNLILWTLDRSKDSERSFFIVNNFSSVSVSRAQYEALVKGFRQR